MGQPKYSLHLFAGAGGGLLADFIDGITPVCAVEIEKYPQRVLASDSQISQSGTMFAPSAPTIPNAPRRSPTYAPLPTILSLPEASLVRISVARDAAKAYAANVAAYGESMLESLARYDRSSCSWKIHPCLFSGDLATFSETWPRWGMMRRGVSYRLPTWEPCTSASGSGSRQDAWPTPCATDYKGPGKTPRDRLDYAVNGKTKSAVYPTPRINSLCGGTGAWNCIQSNPNLTDEEKRGLTSTYGQLNPDWEEWLMAWPVGWTDIETPNIRLVWLDPSIDPADYGEIPRVTSRRDNRPARVKAIGNGQFPLAASVAFFWGRAVLAAMCKSKKGTTKCS